MIIYSVTADCTPKEGYSATVARPNLDSSAAGAAVWELRNPSMLLQMCLEASMLTLALAVLANGYLARAK